MTTSTPPIRVLAALGLAAVLAASLAACGSTGQADTSSTPTTIGTDAAAAAELQQAATAMTAASSYRFTSSVATGSTTTIAGEFVAPDRVHQVVTTGDGHVTEALFVGAQAWAKDSTGAWKSGSSAATGTASPSAMFAALADAGTVSRDGATLRFQLTGDDSFLATASGPQDVVGEAVIDGGHITRLTYRPADPAAQVDVTIDYTDLGAPIVIEAPAA